ncbi:transcriptional regulator, TetR family [Caldanaerobius fijiensis DSM 17918]|uniref:Transcriptional regulator, TetR family n=1 Tax=Caldanaerobius fijiensis DSM 17918 TaxID=1121256 RepID=A0A1M5F4V8_9THEO|nr:TetR/AcrR family transcriptional regulator [Caldanaerobius fijiensis]SHF86554.1 transcriptional regulator, TetR family [Caldanaerobius fijiensis DSM 17918]
MEERVNQSQKILNAACKCISSKGYANVSLRDIAEEAGVVLSQLNYYFGNKEGLFTEVIKMMMNKYLSEINKALNIGETARDKMASLANFFKEMLKNNPGLFRLLYDLTGLAMWSSSFNHLLKNLFDELSNIIEEKILIKGNLKNNLKDYSSRSIARMILGAMLGTAIQAILDPDKEEISDALNAVQVVFTEIV